MKSNLFKKVLVLVLALMLVFTVVACNPTTDDPDDNGGGGGTTNTDKISPTDFFDQMWASANKIGATAVDSTKNFGFELGLGVALSVGEEKLPIDIALKAYLDVEGNNANTAAKIDLDLSFISATLYYFLNEPNVAYAQLGADATLYKLPLDIDADDEVLSGVDADSTFGGNASFAALIDHLLGQEFNKLMGEGKFSIDSLIADLAKSFGAKADGTAYSLNATVEALLKTLGVDLAAMATKGNANYIEIVDTIFTTTLGVDLSNGLDLQAVLKSVATTFKFNVDATKTVNADGTVNVKLPFSGNIMSVVTGALGGLLGEAGVIINDGTDIILGFTRANDEVGSDIKDFAIEINTPGFGEDEDKDLNVQIIINKLKIANTGSATNADYVAIPAKTGAKQIGLKLNGVTTSVPEGFVTLSIPAIAYNKEDSNITTTALEALDIKGEYTLNAQAAFDLSKAASLGGNVVIASLKFGDGSMVKVNFTPEVDAKASSKLSVQVLAANGTDAAAAGTAARAAASSVSMVFANWFVKADTNIWVNGSDVSVVLADQLAAFAASTDKELVIDYGVNVQQLMSNGIVGLFKKTTVSLKDGSSAYYQLVDTVAADAKGIEFKAYSNLIATKKLTITGTTFNGSATAEVDKISAQELNDVGNAGIYKAVVTLSDGSTSNFDITVSTVKEEAYNDALATASSGIYAYAAGTDRATLKTATSVFSKFTDEGSLYNGDITIAVSPGAVDPEAKAKVYYGVDFIECVDSDGEVVNIDVTERVPNTNATDGIKVDVTKQANRYFFIAKKDLTDLADGKYTFKFETALGQQLNYTIEVAKHNVKFNVGFIFDFLFDGTIASDADSLEISISNLKTFLESLLGKNFMGDTSSINVEMAKIVVAANSEIDTIEDLLNAAAKVEILKPTTANNIAELKITYTKGAKTVTATFGLGVVDGSTVA